MRENVVLAVNGHGQPALLRQGADVLLQQVFPFFQHQHALALVQEGADFFFRQGPGHAQFQHAHAVCPVIGGKRVGQIVARNAADNDAQIRGRRGLGNRIEGALLRNLAGAGHNFVQRHMPPARHGGHGHETRRIATEVHLGLRRG